jgi:5-formyltetrahydrofolate cyclo-ligase
MSSTAAINPIRNKLRKALRQRRRSLSISSKHLASKRITQLLMRSGWLRRGQRIAIYLATDEELNLEVMINVARRRGCQLFIPHIVNTRRREMKFYSFNAHSRLIKHRWGMQQLANPGIPIATRRLDAVLVPTVGFDGAGHRLGMGGGFYDRHFASIVRLPHHKPVLIGVAYACQEISAIDVQPHDIQLDAMLTEQALICF